LKKSYGSTTLKLDTIITNTDVVVYNNFETSPQPYFDLSLTNTYFSNKEFTIFGWVAYDTSTSNRGFLF